MIPDRHTAVLASTHIIPVSNRGFPPPHTLHGSSSILLLRLFLARSPFVPEDRPAYFSKLDEGVVLTW